MLHKRHSYSTNVIPRGNLFCARVYSSCNAGGRAEGELKQRYLECERRERGGKKGGGGEGESELRGEFKQERT